MNKKLRSQIWLFSKLAGAMFDYTPERKAKILKEYNDELALLPSKDYKAIRDFIFVWSPESFFAKDEEKIFTMFAENILIATDFKLQSILWRIQDAVGGYYRTEKLKSFVLKYFVDHYIDKMTIENFMKLDDISSSSTNLLPVEYVRKAALEMFKKIKELYNEGDEREALNDMGRMFASHLISQDLVEKFAKHMGADFYAKLMNKIFTPTLYTEEDHKLNRLNDLRNKEKLTVFDIAELLRNSGDYYSPTEFQDILNKADDKGKNYLRGFLYSSYYNIGDYFMLDENFKPINDKYENIAWPSLFYPIFDWSALLDEEDQQKWAQIFADFKVPANIKP